jgi:hypothetical protein
MFYQLESIIVESGLLRTAEKIPFMSALKKRRFKFRSIQRVLLYYLISGSSSVSIVLEKQRFKLSSMQMASLCYLISCSSPVRLVLEKRRFKLPSIQRASLCYLISSSSSVRLVLKSGQNLYTPPFAAQVNAISPESLVSAATTSRMASRNAPYSMMRRSASLMYQTTLNEDHELPPVSMLQTHIRTGQKFGSGGWIQAHF